MTDPDQCMINVIFEIALLEIKTFACVKVVINKLSYAVTSFMTHVLPKVLANSMQVYLSACRWRCAQLKL